MSFNKSVSVISSQSAPHKNLRRLLTRYRETDYLHSIPEYAHEEFNQFLASVKDNNAKIILDSGCGTGESTLGLARAHPEHIVVGVDKSTYRLQRCPAAATKPGNALFVRCDLIHFWRLLHQAGRKLTRHYLLYPNPWPKPGHLQRRWHAHPVFPVIVKLGGILIMRTNWRIYAEEFALALRDYSMVEVAVTAIQVTNAMTAFERKYADSNHMLYEVTVNLSCA